MNDLVTEWTMAIELKMLRIEMVLWKWRIRNETRNLNTRLFTIGMKTTLINIEMIVKRIVEEASIILKGFVQFISIWRRWV
jgi:hypothetical protein